MPFDPSKLKKEGKMNFLTDKDGGFAMPVADLRLVIAALQEKSQLSEREKILLSELERAEKDFSISDPTYWAPKVAEFRAYLTKANPNEGGFRITVEQEHEMDEELAARGDLLRKHQPARPWDAV